MDEDPPDALVNADLRQRAESFVMQLQSQGIGFEQYLAATGQDQVALMEGLKDAAARAVKVDLALRAVAEAEDMQVDEAEIDEEYERIAIQRRAEAGAGQEGVRAQRRGAGIAHRVAQAQGDGVVAP